MTRRIWYTSLSAVNNASCVHPTCGLFYDIAPKTRQFYLLSFSWRLGTRKDAMKTISSHVVLLAERTVKRWWRSGKGRRTIVWTVGSWFQNHRFLLRNVGGASMKWLTLLYCGKTWSPCNRFPSNTCPHPSEKFPWVVVVVVFAGRFTLERTLGGTSKGHPMAHPIPWPMGVTHLTFRDMFLLTGPLGSESS